MYWHNLEIGRKEQALRTAIISIVVVLIALFWAIPIAVLSSVLPPCSSLWFTTVKVSEMAQMPVVGFIFEAIAQHEWMVTVIEGIVPPLLAVASEHLVRYVMTSIDQSLTLYYQC